MVSAAAAAAASFGAGTLPSKATPFFDHDLWGSSRVLVSYMYIFAATEDYSGVWKNREEGMKVRPETH